MISSVPVVKLESEPARKATAPEISLTCARRPKGVNGTTPPSGSSSFMGVDTPPGQIALTRIPSPANSSAAVLVKQCRHRGRDGRATRGDEGELLPQRGIQRHPREIAHEGQRDDRVPDPARDEIERGERGLDLHDRLQPHARVGGALAQLSARPKKCRWAGEKMPKATVPETIAPASRTASSASRAAATARSARGTSSRP